MEEIMDLAVDQLSSGVFHMPRDVHVPLALAHQQDSSFSRTPAPAMRTKVLLVITEAILSLCALFPAITARRLPASLRSVSRQFITLLGQHYPVGAHRAQDLHLANSTRFSPSRALYQEPIPSTAERALNERAT